MDISTWEPHGLITRPVGELTYRDARVKVVNGMITDYRESLTIRAFNSVFYTDIFKGEDHFVCTAKQPVSPNRDLLCDYVIEQFTKDYTFETLCIAGYKPANDEKCLDIAALENQTGKYCQEFLEYYTEADHIYAMTLVGVSIRCWVYRRGESRLQGFWDDNESGSFSHYLDIGLDENKDVLEHAFDKIKASGLASRAPGSRSTFGRTSRPSGAL